jgi:hypothetical protein
MDYQGIPNGPSCLNGFILGVVHVQNTLRVPVHLHNLLRWYNKDGSAFDAGKKVRNISFRELQYSVRTESPVTDAVPFRNPGMPTHMI